MVAESSHFALSEREEKFPAGPITSPRPGPTLASAVAAPEMAVNMPLVGRVQDYLERLAAHAPVVWLGARVEPHIPLGAVLTHGCGHDWRLRPGTAERFAMLDAALAARLADSPVLYRPQADLFPVTLPEDFTDCEGLFWADGDHFSRAGQKRMADKADLIGTLRREMAAE